MNISTSEPIVISLCDRTGVMVEPWLEAGYECWIVDVQHEDGQYRDGNLVRVGVDITEWLPPRRNYKAAFAFPPCTHLANSGARWFKSKGLSALSDSLDLVKHCHRILQWTEAPWMLENPVGQLSTYWRQPDYYFDPCDYGGYSGGEGDTYTKKTCLWTGNGFAMPVKKPVKPVDGSKMHYLPPSDKRGDIRSVTPRGFAQAVFEANAES